MEDHEIKKIVRNRYGKIADPSNLNVPINTSCCGETGVTETIEEKEVSCYGSIDTINTEETEISSCCGSSDVFQNYSTTIGYSKEELESVPKGSNLGLGCGNPTASADLKDGETVLDLGSGAGFDCFLAANQVGKSGKVIGVDMTPQMIDKARQNALNGNYENVEFRLGEIENLPVADNTIDVIISNCVINLSPDKTRVYNEAYRVLKPGGRVVVSDIVLSEELPEAIKADVNAYAGCIAGAMLKDDYLRTIKEAGFKEHIILEEKSFPLSFIFGGSDNKKSAISLKVQAVK